MPQQKLKLGVGIDRDFDRQTPNADGTVGSGFVSTDPLSSIVWAGNADLPLATPTVVWGNSNLSPSVAAPLTIWTIQFLAADTATLAPGLYRLQVFATHGTRTALLFDGLLELISTSGATVDSDLASFTYVETLLAPLRLLESEREMITTLKAEASDAIRKFCSRDFNRQTYTEECSPELNGFIALNQMPVNNVTRIRGYLGTALTITASSSTYQSAWVSWLTTGEWYDYSLAYTGIQLNSVANGVAATTPFLFANYLTVNLLAAAIGNVAGWTAFVAGNLGLHASTDLTSSGTTQGAMDGGASLMVYTEDLATTRLDNATGMLWCGRRGLGGFSGRWGDDGGDIADASPVGRVQVTYDAGFTTIPTPVQLACAELVKATIERLRTDAQKRKNSMGRYNYEITPEQVADLPYAVRCGVAKWRISKVKG